jgi:hypothetical protein
MEQERIAGTIATVIDGFAYLQRLLAPLRDETRDGVRLLAFGKQRRESRFRYELFPYDVPPPIVIEVAREVAGDEPHLISAFGNEPPLQIQTYLAAGSSTGGTRP